ncbi:MAG: hypothetical protein ACK47C_07810 [Paracoccaceae bacterium]
MAVRVDTTKGARGCIAKIEAQLQLYPRNPWNENKAQWDTCHRDLQKLILTEGGSYKSDGMGSQVRLWGYKATSTTGLEGAARNWIVQVREKLGVQA